MKLNWFITVADEFGTLRTIHPAGFGTGGDRVALDAIIARHVIPTVVMTATAQPPKTMLPVLDPKEADMMTQGEIARASGYTGDPCQHCGAFKLKVSGHCFVCEACGETTGCS